MSTNIFQQFAKMVAASFQTMTSDANVFVADIDGDVLYAKYLASFHEGTNPIFRKNTEHDCSACKHFIRRAGAVVTLADNGEVRTVWDEAAKRAPRFYAAVAIHMRHAVRTAGVRDLFRVGKNEGAFGAEQTRSLDAQTQNVVRWNHLYTGSIAADLRAMLPDTDRGNYRTSVQVFERGLVELSPEAVETVRSLANDNNLYRGEEHLPAIKQFQKLQQAFLAKGERERRLFVWANAGASGAMFRNTVIGTLVQDLSKGVELERAVASFEAKVAPQNYKRTTALITSGMLKGALKTIAELDLEPALERRFAVISDISVNDVKWVDGTVRPLMKYGLANLMQQHLAGSPVDTKKDEERAEDIGLDDFVARVLPETESLEVLFKGEQLGNLMSLTAPVHPEPKQLFRYSNDFAWSYSGNVADSIKERVKKAGGKVDGAALRVSLSWFNFDDLDLHIYASRGWHIYFGHKDGIPGGRLDVDMNAGVGRTRQAVENIVWPKIPRDDSYKVVVHNFCQRETTNPGFVVEVESGGKLSHYSYNKILRTREDVTVVTLPVFDGAVGQPSVGPGIVAANIAQEKWGLTTERYVKVNAVMLSPNYWGDNHVGNKHTFFVLEGCKSDEDTRGFYNEFLHQRLEPHRKVFEIIADQTKCRPTEGQLSGLGFSSTKKESFLVRARQGKRQRIFNVQVGAARSMKEHAEAVLLAMDTHECPYCGAEMDRESNHERDSSNDVHFCPQCKWSYGETETWRLKEKSHD